MLESILGGALLPHAPQFFTRPSTEDADTIARVERVGARIGQELAALAPDVWITVSNDHAQQVPRSASGSLAAHAGLLAASDYPAMVALGVHPLVPFLARLALEREGHFPSARR